jgi:transposase
MLSSDQLQQLDQLGEAELRMLAQELMARLSNADGELQTKDRKLVWSTARIEQLTHEIAVLKRWKFSARSEQLDAAQKSLLDEDVDADIAAVELELETLRTTPRPSERQQPRRAPLPAHLPRTVLRHEPESTTCACGCALKRFGEDISEKLDYTPGVFTVERHIRGKWACAKCQSLVQAPVHVQVIDKGLPTAGLLAQVLVAKYADHLPLHRQESIFARAGMALSRSTLAEWVGTCGVRLQPLVDALKQEVQALGGAHPLPRRRAPAHRQQLGGKPDPTDCNELFIVPLFVKCLKTLRFGSRRRRDTGRVFARWPRSPADRADRSP